MSGDKRATEAFAEARKIVDGKVEGPRKNK
jgi:hypothetical protein